MDGTVPASPALALEHVTKRFRARNRTVAALDDCCLEVQPGEVVALVGPNGAGKSTALRVVAGLVRPDSGSIRIAGRARLERSERAALVGGMLDGASTLYARLTVRENLEYFAALKGMRPSQARERGLRLLEPFGLAVRAGDPFQKLSRGQRQCVAIACHALHQPRLLLLDEPSLGLDPGAQARIAGFLATLRDAGAGILVASHQLDFIEQVASRVAFIRAGRVECVARDRVAGRLGDAYARAFA